MSESGGGGGISLLSRAAGSGGKGLHNGGDGVIRVRAHLTDLLVKIQLTQCACRRSSSLSTSKPCYQGRPHLTIPRRPIQCSILSERRVYHPYGLHGGGDGACGQNIWIKQPRASDGDGGRGAPRRVNLGGKATLRMGKGDRIVVCTPGGGAWGAPGGEKQLAGAKGTHGRGDARGGAADRAAEQLGA